MDKYKLNIREFRKNKKLNQQQLSEMIGISRSYLSEIENGKWDIRLSLLLKIGEALEMNPFILIEFKNKEIKSPE